LFSSAMNFLLGPATIAPAPRWSARGESAANPPFAPTLHPPPDEVPTAHRHQEVLVGALHEAIDPPQSTRLPCGDCDQQTNRTKLVRACARRVRRVSCVVCRVRVERHTSMIRCMDLEV
jgi:hypothetical protein